MSKFCKKLDAYGIFKEIWCFKQYFFVVEFFQNERNIISMKENVFKWKNWFSQGIFLSFKQFFLSMVYCGWFFMSYFSMVYRQLLIDSVQTLCRSFFHKMFEYLYVVFYMCVTGTRIRQILSMSSLVLPAYFSLHITEPRKETIPVSRTVSCFTQS